MESFRKVDKDGIIRYEKENGDLHRTDGPAYQNPSGYKSWIINGKYHREDGPARILSSGDGLYYLNDKYYNKEEWEVEVTKLKLKRIKDL